MNIDELTVGEIKKISALAGALGGSQCATQSTVEPCMRIVIGQRGWVWVGLYSRVGNRVKIERAWSIRRWGTFSGLGQIADDGPTDKTILDKVPTVRLHRLAVVGTIDCDHDAWMAVDR